MVRHGDQRQQPNAHVTARLALKILEDTPQPSRSRCSSSGETGSPTCPIYRKISALRRALRDSNPSTTLKKAAQGPTLKHDLSDAIRTASFVALMNTNNPAPATVAITPTSASGSDGSSVASWEEDDSLVFEDRGRMGAAARTTSIDNNPLPRPEEDISPAIRPQPSYSEWSVANPLDEFDHPALRGAVAALHGYAASDGDPGFLEKAYELARVVAGSSHALDVSFDACRIALAVGYVHTLIRGAPDMANTFAHQHSLPKLAQSLEPYWSRSSSPTPAEEAKWEECVSSLLEVTSSVALVTGERDIWAVLEEKVFGGVSEAIALYLIRRPDDLVQYQGVGSACLRHHVLSVRSSNRSVRGLTDSE